MGLYLKMEKLLKYRIRRTLDKGLLRRDNISLIVKYALLLIAAFLLAGILNIGTGDPIIRTMTIVVNILFITGMYMIYRSLDSKKKEFFMYYIGIMIIMISTLFIIWISLGIR